MAIDKAALEAAEEMGRRPNSGGWDLPSNLDETLSVGRALLAADKLLKAEKAKAKKLRAQVKKAKRDIVDDIEKMLTVERDALKLRMESARKHGDFRMAEVYQEHFSAVANCLTLIYSKTWETMNC